MAENVELTQGTISNYDPDKGGTTITIPYPVIGIVKDNIDSTRSGQIRVYIAKYSGGNPEDANSWISVKYMSPWFGLSQPRRGGNTEGDGSFVSNPHTYGMWMSSPDVGSQVICIFVNGHRDQGYYIGGAPHVGMHHMVPALGGSSAFIPNAAEAKAYGGAQLLPTVEANFSNPAVRKDRQPYNLPKPVHSYQASIYAAQGLLRDNIRGVINSSSQRDNVSAVFGVSTPGRPIYAGGYDARTILQAAASEDSSKLEQVGRTGGHSIVMDDGTLDGQNQMMRFRTGGGHQITMSDDGQTVFITHANGNSWIELGREGTVDIFANNSVNIRTKGDLNLHADRDVNIHATRNLNMFGSNVKVESDYDTTMRAGGNIQQHCLMNWSFKVEGSMTLESTAPASFSSKTITFVKGKMLMLNTGSAGTPATVKQMTKSPYEDTVYDPDVGWMNPAPNPLFSIVSRITAHQPYAYANKGVAL